MPTSLSLTLYSAIRQRGLLPAQSGPLVRFSLDCASVSSMANRREFMQAALAASAWMAIHSMGSTQARTQPHLRQFLLFLADGRRPRSCFDASATQADAAHFGQEPPRTGVLM